MAINRETDFANGRFVEVIGNIRVVRSFVHERAESDIFATSGDRLKRAANAHGFIERLPQSE